MGQLDAIGRATFHHIASHEAVCPTNRQVRWLKHIERHGPQSSVLLYELTCDTHRCRDTALRQMQHLRAGGFLSLPIQQRATERAEFNPYIYDLTPKAKRWLADRDLAEPTFRPTGHWWHGFAVSSVTSTIDIAAARMGVRFIPAHALLARRSVGLGIPIHGKLLIPDQLFALDYGGKYRSFVLELDRGTEPMTSPASRKSLAAAVDAYAAMIAGDLGRAHYGIKSSLLVQWVFQNSRRAVGFLDLLRVRGGKAAQSVLVQVQAEDGVSRGLNTELFTGEWQRADGSQVCIGMAV